MSVLILQAGQQFPNVLLPKLSGGSINLGQPEGSNDWKMVVVYRGMHCPLCTRYLQELNQAVPELNKLNIDVVAISADSKERAISQLSEVSPNYDVGYDLTIEQMKILGLYISSPRLGMGAERPFSEPGMFIINEKGTVQMIDISNVPFARPPIASMLMGLKFIRGMKEEFPINGSYTK